MKKSNNKAQRQAKLQTKKRVQEQKLKRDGIHYKGHLISREKHNQILKEKKANDAYWENQRRMFRTRTTRLSERELDFMGEVIDRMTPPMPYGMDKLKNHGVRRSAELAATFDVLDSVHTGISIKEKYIVEGHSSYYKNRG